MNKFRVGVSDWKLKFESGEEVLLNTVTKEGVSITSDKKVRIWLRNASFDARFIDMFKHGARISEISQEFTLIDSRSNEKTIIGYNYAYMEISNILISGCSDEIAVVDVVFKSRL